MNKKTTQRGLKGSIHPPSLIPHPLVEGEDFYLEGGFLVFTARYHLRRGYCCGSGCRHCPYEGGAGPDGEGAVENESAA